MGMGTLRLTHRASRPPETSCLQTTRVVSNTWMCRRHRRRSWSPTSRQILHGKSMTRAWPRRNTRMSGAAGVQLSKTNASVASHSLRLIRRYYASKRERKRLLSTHSAIKATLADWRNRRGRWLGAGRGDVDVRSARRSLRRHRRWLSGLRRRRSVRPRLFRQRRVLLHRDSPLRTNEQALGGLPSGRSLL